MQRCDKPSGPEADKKRRRAVSFCPSVTVNTYAAARERHARTAADFQEQRHAALTRFQGKKSDARGKEAPLINTEGKVCSERRRHQRSAVNAVLSLQRKLHRKSTGGCVVASSEVARLLSAASLKLSQRSGDVAREVARQVLLEVHPLLQSASNSVPIDLAEFPRLKTKPQSERDESCISALPCSSSRAKRGST